MSTEFYFLILSLIVGFITAYKAIPVIINISKLKGLTDNPDEKRKIHDRKVPNVGGVGVFFGFVVSCGLAICNFIPDYFTIMTASLIILFFIGIKDDILVIDWRKKLAGQILAGGLIVFAGGIYVPGLDGLFAIYNFPQYTGMLFSVFAIIIITNSFNLIDGVDGLAGTLSLIASAVFGTWFILGGHYSEAIILFSLTGALAAFLFFNFEPAKIFLGDTGSLMIGFILSVSAFRLMQLNPDTAYVSLARPAIFAFSVMIIPMFDTLRVIIIRILKRRSPLKPDNNHIHHNLLDKGFNHRDIVFVLSFVNLLIISISVLINSWEPHLYFLFITVSGIIISPLADGLQMIMSILRIRRKPVYLPVDEKKPGEKLASDVAPGNGNGREIRIKKPKEKERVEAD